VARKTLTTTHDGSTESASEVPSTLDASIAQLSYEDAMNELERLVESIEQGDVGLEASLKSYRRGEQLLRHCKTLLEKAETTVRQLSLADLESGSESK
jgi:exodeoxyribonuclease VII small subunit